MVRGLKRSLIMGVGKSTTDIELEASAAEEVVGADAMPPAFQRSSRGSGSAWKAGAVAQAQAGLDEARKNLAEDIVFGDHVIEIDPELITDPIGSDRRDDWMEQEDFLSLVESIRENGQDLPILVWPEDAKWQPDPLDPSNLERVQFLLLAGRRRREAAIRLGQPVRAVIASQEGRDGSESTFNMLVLRFRENEERQDLSAYERLISIGHMFDELTASSNTKVKAKEFAKRIGVHESIVSRARAVHEAKHQILNAFKNVYDMSFHDLQRAMATLGEPSPDKVKVSSKSKKLKVIRKVGVRNLSVETVDGKLSIKTTGVKLNKERLEGLGDLVAAYLMNDGSN